MISAQEFYERVEEAHEIRFNEQLKCCEEAIEFLFNNVDYNLLRTGRVRVLLERDTDPMLVQHLKKLGYVDIKTEPSEEDWELTFSVPQLANKEDSTSNKNTL